jgi:hypothetical protein
LFLDYRQVRDRRRVLAPRRLCTVGSDRPQTHHFQKMKLLHANAPVRFGVIATRRLAERNRVLDDHGTNLFD